MEPPYRVQDIHALRVEIKKLKALLTVLEENKNVLSIGLMSKLLKPVFRAAGRVRELHLLRAYLQQRPAAYRPKGLLRLVESALQKAATALHRLIRHRTFLAALAHLSAEELSSGKLKATIRKKEKKLQHHLQRGNRQPEALHRLRQKMKSVSYLWTASGESKDSYKEWMHQAGCWHDTVRLMELLQEWQVEGKATKVDAARLQVFINHLRMKENGYYRRLIKEWPV